MARKRDVKQDKEESFNMPPWAAMMFFGLALPQTYYLYKLIWNDANSDEFFDTAERAITWIAEMCALEAAAGVALGYIDYKTKMGNEKSLLYAMRKKRLAFAKFPLIMAIGALMFVDQPSPIALGMLTAG